MTAQGQQRGVEPVQVQRPPPALCAQVAFEPAEGHRGPLDAPDLRVWKNFGAKQVALWRPVRVGDEKLRV